MRIMVSLEHPSLAHQYHYVMRTALERGDELLVLAARKDGVTELLDAFGIPYTVSTRTTGKNALQKGLVFLRLCAAHTRRARRFHPDIVISNCSPMTAVAARLCGAPHLLYEDTEVNHFSLNICKRFSTRILTGESFLYDLGPKHRRVDGYKELFYLDPAYFQPDPQALLDCGMNPDERYVIVRFVGWNASHDVGRAHLPEAGKLPLVQALSQLVRVYVSSETPLSPELQPYALPIPFAQMHHALAFASLVFSEGASLASEAAVLGTHAIYVNPTVLGYIGEMDRRYGLIDQFQTGESAYALALERARELLADGGQRVRDEASRQRLLHDKVMMTPFFLAQMDELVAESRRSK